MGKIKVCLLLNDFGVGGTSKVVYDILREIDLNIFKIFIILLSPDETFLQKKKISPEIKIYKINFQFDSNYSLRRYFHYALKKKLIIKDSPEIINIIVKEKPDILHFHTQPRELLMGHVLKKLFPYVELLYTDHLLRIEKNQYSSINRYLLALIYRNYYWPFNTISVSKSVWACQKRFGWQNPKMIHRLIENRIRLDEYSKKEYLDRDKIMFTYVARLSTVKNHNFLLEAWKRVNNDKFILQLIGDGDLVNTLKRKVENESIRNVKFLGNIENVKLELLNSDIALFPSTREGLPIALLEKMAVGLPVISSNIPELTDFIVDNKNGLVYHNLDDFVNKINLLGNSKDLRKKLGETARESLVERFENKTLGQENMDFYHNILK